MTKPQDYLRDPDEQMKAIAETSSEPVQASNKSAAKKKCKDLANKYDLHLEDVEQRGSNWFDCLFRGK
ncbi:MAG TPA: hypothetical protein DCL61_29310 [Cyanobacteria bacterium UBA12227]|nr:hypothetical protein [Cyanobacteria bacterium UBA12227]HBY77457.1 hypothetical protein [Cyanobacteria bacterium UBA11148]